MILKTVYFLLISVIAYAPYKGKNFVDVGWKKAAVLSSLFAICSLLLLLGNYQKIFVSLNSIALTIFLVTTTTWYLFSKFIHRFGQYPASFLSDKKNSMRFIVRFEPATMVIKYFEIVFQQAGFLYVLFVILEGYSFNQVILLFTLIVSIFHLGNLLFIHYKWTLFYFVLSIPMAIFFGYMISRGLVLLTASTHLAFYLVFNARYWFPERVRLTRNVR